MASAVGVDFFLFHGGGVGKGFAERILRTVIVHAPADLLFSANHYDVELWHAESFAQRTAVRECDILARRTAESQEPPFADHRHDDLASSANRPPTPFNLVLARAGSNDGLCATQVLARARSRKGRVRRFEEDQVNTLTPACRFCLKTK